jgi:hypothetical protein
MSGGNEFTKRPELWKPSPFQPRTHHRGEHADRNGHDKRPTQDTPHTRPLSLEVHRFP